MATEEKVRSISLNKKNRLKFTEMKDLIESVIAQAYSEWEFMAPDPEEWKKSKYYREYY